MTATPSAVLTTCQVTASRYPGRDPRRRRREPSPRHSHREGHPMARLTGSGRSCGQVRLWYADVVGRIRGPCAGAPADRDAGKAAPIRELQLLVEVRDRARQRSELLLDPSGDPA